MTTNTKTTVLCGFLLLVLLTAVFHPLLFPGVVLFSNDLPLGRIHAAFSDMPEAVKGSWDDLNWIGIELPAYAPGFHPALRLLTSPEFFLKLHGPLSLLFVGVAACVFFRRAGLGAEASVVGSVAAILNTALFSAACWGVMGFVLTWAYCFLALAFLWPWRGPRLWARTMLCGFSLGMAINDGIDVAALFSLLIAAAVMHGEWLQPGPAVRRLLLGGVRTATVALCAAVIAAHALSTLISTQIEGVGVLQAEQESKEEKWNWATQWSLPKVETLGFAVPGLFGYRMDTPEGGNYWGSIGRDPRLDAWHAGGRAGPPPPGSGLRFSGGGMYAGALVLLVVLWALHRSLRPGDSALLPQGRPWIWFWAGVAFVTLLLAWGRFAPFYQIAYALPGISSIRNPIKFGHITSFALVILFAYGVDGLLRLNQAMLADAKSKAAKSLGDWWRRARMADGRFVIIISGLLGLMALAGLMYASAKPDLEKYLVSVQFDPSMASSMASFSITQAAWGLLRYVIAGVIVLALLSGWFAGARLRWAPLLLGAFLLADLVPANRHWIVYVDVPRKYDENPVVDFFKQSGPESRVAFMPFPGPGPHGLLQGVYSIEWAQHHFPKENIQSLDIVQMPRPPADRRPFEMALQPAGDPASLPRIARRWELTSTRHLLGSVQAQLPWGVEDTLDFLNRALDPQQQRFRMLKRFTLEPKAHVTQPTQYEDFTATLATNGPFAIFEFTGALPKAGLYTHWQVEADDDITLQAIARADFDPHRSVLVANPIDGPAEVASPSPVTPVEWVRHEPKTIVLRATTESPAVLLLNDRYDPDWTVTVNGEPAELLRCNFIMRGVWLEPGESVIEFKLRPGVTGLYVSLAAIALAFVLLGVVVLGERGSPPNAPGPRLTPAAAIKAPSDGPKRSRKA